MGITRLTTEQIKIRDFAELKNDAIRADWEEQARQKRITKIKKWLVIGGVVIVILILVLGRVFF